MSKRQRRGWVRMDPRGRAGSLGCGSSARPKAGNGEAVDGLSELACEVIGANDDSAAGKSKDRSWRKALGSASRIQGAGGAAPTVLRRSTGPVRYLEPFLV